MVLITLTYVMIIITGKMPTPKPFAHFLGTIFLIYPNLASLAIIAFDSERFEDSIFGTIDLIIVLALNSVVSLNILQADLPYGALPLLWSAPILMVLL